MTAALAQQDLLNKPLTPRRYKNPPVIEALVDVRVETTDPVDLEILQQIRFGEESKYPTETAYVAQSITVDVATGIQTDVQNQIKGYRFFSASQREIVLVRPDGFTFSKLPPYTGWDEWKPEAARLWGKYLRTVRATKITRVAVRYVNRIDIELPAEPLRHYLTVYPHLGDKLPQQVAGFVMQLSLPQSEMPGVMFNISQGRLLNPSDNRVSILLDLDLFREGELDPKGDDLWKWLEWLHVQENALFEGCITNRARELFDR